MGLIMWHYLRYFFKLLFGFLVIIALHVILKKADTSLGDWDWWLYTTLISYNGYCYLDYRLTDKD